MLRDSFSIMYYYYILIYYALLLYSISSIRENG